MNTFQDVFIKKRHNGYAEIRSYMFDAIKARGKGIRFIYQDEHTQEIEVMHVPFSNLNKGFVTATGIKSKVNKGQIFDLISFIWQEHGETADNDQIKLFE